jgi:hypothetical protein
MVVVVVDQNVVAAQFTVADIDSPPSPKIGAPLSFILSRLPS